MVSIIMRVASIPLSEDQVAYGVFAKTKKKASTGC